MTSVSFIIPHKGRDDMLIQTLDSIVALNKKDCDLEVIIVSQNDSASDATLAFEAKLKLSVLYNEGNKTISTSRNMGVRHASGEYLAFLDADIQLAPNWLEAMLYSLTCQHAVLASAMQKNSEDAPPLERIRTALSNAVIDDYVTFLPGRNLFLSKQVFEKVGGFPEHLITCEDYYFTERVAAIGKLFYTSRTYYIHIGEDKAFGPMFKKEIWRGQSNLASITGRQVPLREWPSFVVPMVPPSAMICAFTTWCLGHGTLASACLIIAILPILAYAFRLKRMGKKQVSFMHCLQFYTVYFPARAIGTIAGMFAGISTSSHK